MFNGIFVSLLCSLNIFHPYALGMACGTGSASMLSASLAAVVEAYPDMEAEITAYAATSNMLSSVDGLYMSLFIALPMCEFMYKLFTKNSRHYSLKESNVLSLYASSHPSAILSVHRRQEIR